jgi:hypothetical protein
MSRQTASEKQPGAPEPPDCFSQACLTPGITRTPEPLKIHDNLRVAGRVHAVVRPHLTWEGWK